MIVGFLRKHRTSVKLCHFHIIEGLLYKCSSAQQADSHITVGSPHICEFCTSLQNLFIIVQLYGSGLVIVGFYYHVNTKEMQPMLSCSGLLQHTSFLMPAPAGPTATGAAVQNALENPTTSWPDVCHWQRKRCASRPDN